MDVLIPFLKLDEKTLIDAYFLNKVSFPYTRILLVRSSLKNMNYGEGHKILSPLSLSEIYELLKEGYSDLQKKIEEVKNKKTNLDSLDIIFSTLYNPGYYFKKREGGLTVAVLFNIYKSAYNLVLSKLERLRETGANTVFTYAKVNIANSQIFLDDNKDEVYNYLFSHDSSFRNAMLNVLS
ncbi:MAG: hypothetical protein OWQ54_05665 [Sulfolobaceae archaeon]|nr:hypothetical protein [Sulfolobaceae archaeon]